jgi:hypothetical protein
MGLVERISASPAVVAASALVGYMARLASCSRGTPEEFGV